MIARYVQKGEAVDYRPTESVAAGDIIVREALVGVARLDIPAGTLGALAVTGVFEVPKGSEALAAGVPVYWDAENGKATHVAAGKPYLGKAVHEATSADASVVILLNAPFTATVG